MNDVKKEAALGSLHEEIKSLNKYISKFKTGKVTVTASDGETITVDLDKPFIIQALQRKRSSLTEQAARLRAKT